MEHKIKLHENTATEQLRKLSVHLGGDFIEGYGTARCALDNDRARGYINSYDLVPGLAVRTYNVTFFKELRLSKDESKLDPLYFLYALKGVYFHSFGTDEKPVKLEEKQNVILRCGPEVSNEIILPAGIHLELSVIFLTRDDMVGPGATARPLAAGLKEIFGFLDNRRPYRYLGEINLNIARPATVLIENERTDIIGRMITEAAVMNTIAEHVKGYESEPGRASEKLRLTKHELSRIAGIGDFIEQNLSGNICMESICKEVGMSPNKVQAGAKFLFGQTFNRFVQTVRLEQARRYLLSSDMNVSQISEKIGISSKSYFSKTFSERFGVTPSTYREHLLSNKVLFELSYRSRARPNLSPRDVKNIVGISRKHNANFDVTGCLIHREGVFFQILEGPKSNVLKLMDRIYRDDRHYDIEVLWKGPKSDRIFAEWNMALVSEKGNIDLPIEGNIRNINIVHLEGELKEPSVASEILWRRVRNIMRTTT